MKTKEGNHEVYIYACSIENISIEECNKATCLLFSDRKDKYNNYRKNEDKKRCIVAVAVLDYILLKHFGVKDEGWHYSSNGKPSLVQNPNIKFSISHSGKWVLVAVGNCNVGIDVEEHHNNMNYLFEYVLSKNERIIAEQLSERDADDYFVRVWTAKEAYTKMIGIGLLKKFKELDIVYKRNNITIEDMGKKIKSCYIEQKKLKDDYWYTICLDEDVVFLKNIIEITFEELLDTLVK